MKIVNYKYNLVIISNYYELNLVLKSFDKYTNDNSYYIDFSNNSQIYEDTLKSHGFSKLIINSYSLEKRENFLKDYIELIDDISFKNNSRIWWASEIASKNRFTSNLQELLFQYSQSVNTINNLDYETLIILSHNKILINALYKYCKKINQELTLLRQDRIFKIVLFDKFKKIYHLVRSSIVIYVKSILARIYLNNKMRGCRNNREIFSLFKSHIHEGSFDNLNNYIDKYYGKLPKLLSKKSNILFLVHIHGNYINIIKKIKNSSTSNLFPVEYFINLRDIISAIVHFSKAEIKTCDTKFNGLDVTDIIDEEFSRSGVSLHQWLIYECTRNLLKYFKFDYAYMTYEGTAWENMFLMALNNFSHKTKIIGYQHSCVPQSAASMFIGKKECNIKPLPCKLLTVGLETKEILNYYGNYSGSMVDVGCALRYEYLKHSNPKNIRKNKFILVALEGINNVSLMVNYVLKYVNELKDYNFIIRTHPVLPWSVVRKDVKYDINRLSNVSLSSNKTLNDDLNQADICVYWGSTVALEALNMGIPSIHYDVESVLSYDPVFRSNYLKWIVTNNDSLPKLIEKITSLSDEEYTRQAILAKAYIKRYFYPVSDENVSKFLYI